MRFNLVDRVLEESDDRVVTAKLVSNAEEYLGDHFPTFPVLPGVFMLEAMVQAARHLLTTRHGEPDLPMVLGEVRALKYGTFVRPGHTMVIEAKQETQPDADGEPIRFKATAYAVEPGTADWSASPVAASGKFFLRPARPASD